MGIFGLVTGGGKKGKKTKKSLSGMSRSIMKQKKKAKTKAGACEFC